MYIKKTDPDCKNLASIFLQQNKVLIVPCDTIYGFIGSIPLTDMKIRKIKGRGESNPFLRIISSCDISSFSDFILPDWVKNLWPGPLTLILPVKKELIQKMGCETLAVRYPDDPWLVELAQSVGGMVYSTSVNRSGVPPMNDFHEIYDEFKSEVELFIDGGNLTGKPSTLLNLAVSPFSVLREGAISIPKEYLK